jgi:type VI secretion system protein ImpK
MNPNAAGGDRRPENLALMFQEIFIVIERLRSNRQAVSDSMSFRHQVREVIKMAEAESRNRGYSAEEIQLAIFAVVAFLDESILNLRNPIFADWPRQPLQEEFFGHHVAGEIFYQHLQKLLGMNDSQSLADVLEVYYLCMLMGFAGRYTLGNRAEMQGVLQMTAEKIHRIRRTNAEISPAWMPAGGQFVAAAGRDPWVMRFALIAGFCVLLTIALFVVYKFTLSSSMVGQAVRLPSTNSQEAA